MLRMELFNSLSSGAARAVALLLHPRKTKIERNRSFLFSLGWSRESDLNRRPAAYKAAALPAELSRREIIIARFEVFLWKNGLWKTLQ